MMFHFDPEWCVEVGKREIGRNVMAGSPDLASASPEASNEGMSADEAMIEKRVMFARAAAYSVPIATLSPDEARVLEGFISALSKPLDR